MSMPVGTRDRALAAAIELLGEQGVRALTHARVDAWAGLPAGSTSNWFRTKRALLAGLVDEIAERERADADPAALQGITTVDDLVDACCGMVEAQSTVFAARTRARYALFLELSHDPELAAPLLGQRAQFEEWTEALVAGVGIPAPGPATRALMALLDGLLLHRLTIDPDLAIRPVVERALRDLAGT